MQRHTLGPFLPTELPTKLQAGTVALAGTRGPLLCLA